MRLRKQIAKKYVWLKEHYMSNLVAIGLAFFVSNVGWLFLGAISIYEAKHNKYILASLDINGIICHWIEFVSNCIPICVILVKYPVQDMFAEFNKFPEQISQVSIMQYPQQTLLHNQIGERGSINTDLFGFPVNLAYNARDSDLILAEQMFKDDDESLLERYRVTETTTLALS